MPEGHVCHRLATSLTRSFAKSVVETSSPQGRFDSGAAILNGLELAGATAYGKHVLVEFRKPSAAARSRRRAAATLHIHLGLYGRTAISTAPGGPPVGQVRLRMSNDTSVFDLRGPSACDLLDPDGVEALLARLGPDPIRRDADREGAWAKVHRSRSAIALLLMNQEVFAGVGNIFRAEVLHRAGIDPMRPGCEVARVEFDALWDDLVLLMSAAVRRGRIDGLRPEHLAAARERTAVRGGRSRKAAGDGAPADRYAGRYYVYGRAGEPCVLCSAEVAWGDLAGRTLFWCPTCQSA